MSPEHNWQFWATVAGAAVFRAWAADKGVPIRTVAVGIFGGVFAAMICTDPLLAYLNADPATYKLVSAAMLVMTGDSLLRLIMLVARDPSKGIELWKSWKGTGK